MKNIIKSAAIWLGIIKIVPERTVEYKEIKGKLASRHEGDSHWVILPEQENE